jgi:hypothetical protein
MLHMSDGIFFGGFRMHCGHDAAEQELQDVWLFSKTTYQVISPSTYQPKALVRRSKTDSLGLQILVAEYGTPGSPYTF